jgi:hypothetical protein
MAKKDKNTQSQENESLASGVSKKFKQNPGLYIGSVVILVLVIVTFLGGDLLSGGGFGGGRRDYTFGYYDNIAISWVPGNIFAQHIENIAGNFRAQGGNPDDPWIMPQIWELAFQRTVIDTAVLQIMKKSNYIIPEQTIDMNVFQSFHFQENGRFSEALYNQMSDSFYRNLRRRIEEDLIKTMFFNSVSSLLIPASEAEFIANMASTVRRFELVLFNVDDYPASEFLAFAEENSELFSSIHLSKITISNEREANRILESIRDGTNLFEDVARSHFHDGFADRGGDIGSRLFFELDQEIPSLFDRQAVAGLARGELSHVINVGNGFAFFRVEEELTPPNFEDVNTMDRVRSYVRNFQRGRMEDWAVARAEEFINEVKNSDFDSAVRMKSLVKQSLGPLPINFGRQDNMFRGRQDDMFSGGLDIFPTLESFFLQGIDSHDLRSLSSNENFWRIAFSTEIGTPSEPVVQGRNVLVFLPVEETAADEEVIDNIKSIYLAYWLLNAAEQSLQSYFLEHPKMRNNFDEVYRSIFSF